MSRRITQGYDWLTVSFTHEANKWILEPNLPDLDLFSRAVSMLKAVGIGLPAGGNTLRRGGRYQSIVCWAKGGVVASQSVNPTQGSSIELSGSHFATIHLQDQRFLLRALYDGGAHPTRVDVRVDFFDYKTGIAGLFDKVRPRVEGGGRAIEYISEGGVPTVYIGSRKSDFRVRVYDKGHESGMGGDWMRVEAQYRNDAAHGCLQNPLYYMRQSHAKVAKLLVGMGYAFVDHLESLAEGASPLPTTQPREKGRFERWFEASIAPSLLKLAKEDPEGYEVARSLILAVIDDCDKDVNFLHR